MSGRIQNAIIKLFKAEKKSFFPATGWFPIARELQLLIMLLDRYINDVSPYSCRRLITRSLSKRTEWPSNFESVMLFARGSSLALHVLVEIAILNALPMAFSMCLLQLRHGKEGCRIDGVDKAGFSAWQQEQSLGSTSASRWHW